MTLQTTTRALGTTIIVDCRGRVVLEDAAAALRYLVTALLDESPHIVLNLTDVAHIDSAGIGMLVYLHAKAGKAGAVIKLAGLGGHPKRVVDVTKLATVFEVYPTAEEAAASFGPTAL